MSRGRPAGRSTGTCSPSTPHEPERYRDQLAACDRCRRGGRHGRRARPCRSLVAMNMSFLTYCALFMMPGWGDVMSLPVPERIAQLPRPRRPALHGRAGRARPRPACSRRLADWGRYVIGDTYSRGQRGPEGPASSPTSPPSAGTSTRSTRCSTSCSPTTCARCCGRGPTDDDAGVLAAARRGVGRTRGHDRRLRRRRPPRPHVRRALHRPSSSATASAAAS